MLVARLGKDFLATELFVYIKRLSHRRNMVRSLRTFPLLDGYRGAPRCDVAAIEDVLLRVSAMVEAHPEIIELDCNPLIVTSEEAVIVDARIRVEAAQPQAPMPSLDA